MAKYRRQPKAGDLARKPSAPFAIRPREFAADNFAPAPHRAAPLSEREPTIIPAEFKITRVAAGVRASDSYSWKLKGGMMGGATGACRGVCSHNGLGVVPQAFIK
jgi:hypothetical protein